MTGLAHDDNRFEQDLRAVLADLAPDAAPGSLRAAVAAVPGRPVGNAPGRGRTLLAVMGLAAAVVLAVAGIGLLTGPRSIPPAGVSPTDGVPTAVPTSSPATASLTFRVLTPDGSTATKAQVLAVESVMEARLQSYGIENFSSSGSDDRITFEVPLPSADPASVAPVRALLGTTGAFSIVPLGADPVEPGTGVEGLAQPLVSGDAVLGANVVADDQGAPLLDLRLDQVGATAIAGYTRQHVGDFMAIALDGVAVVVPTINVEIPDGEVLVSFGGVQGADASHVRMLAGILDAGPLPLPVEAVTP